MSRFNHFILETRTVGYLQGAGILRMLPLQDIEWDLCSMLVSSVSTAFSMLRKELLLDEATISSRFLSDRVLVFLCLALFFHFVLIFFQEYNDLFV